MLQLGAFWESDIDPLTVAVTNTTGQSVQITSVMLDNTDLYNFEAPTTCVVNEILPPNGQCTITLGIE